MRTIVFGLFLGLLVQGFSTRVEGLQTVTGSAQPGQSVLLLGEPTVASTSNVIQKFFPAQKHSSNPVMRRTEKWEGVGPYLWGSRLMQDQENGELRMWYITYDYRGNFYRWGYATSSDAVHWTKPDLGLEKFEGSLAKNLLPLGPHPEKGTRTVARDPRPETPSHRRYLGVRFTYEGEFISFSPDGLAWLEYPLNPPWHVPSDIIHVMWDERRNCFTAYYKLWEVSGTLLDGSKSGEPFLAYMPTFDTTNHNDGTTSFGGPMVHFQTNGSAQVKRTNFVLRSANQGKDDGGGTSLSGAWVAKRVQAWAESNDGIHWKNEQLILRADKNDPPTSNIQFMFVTQQGSYYIGFLTMHDEAGHFRIQLAWSGDGLRWNRPWRETWLDVGREGSFDSGMVLGPADPIFWKKETWFPYGGFPIRHDSTRQDWQSAIGMAVTRLDGYAAWEANEEVGEIVTQPFHCEGGQLFINAEAKKGSVLVEVMDKQGKAMDRFELGACRSITGDTLEEGNGWVQWKKEKDLGRLKGKEIQLRFRLKNARLYSYRFADDSSVDVPTPRATTH